MKDFVETRFKWRVIMCASLRVYAERGVLAQDKASTLKRKLERTFSAKSTSICLCRTELDKLDCTLESTGQVLNSLIQLRVESSISIFPRSLGDSNAQPKLQPTDMEVRWPQIRYIRQEFYSDRTQISDWLKILAGYLNPMGPFIKVQTSRPYRRPTESESQEMRFWTVCVLTTTTKKSSRTW